MKKGLDYFPFETHGDDRLDLFQAECGILGFGIYVKILARIYGTEGYFCEASDENLRLFAQALRVPFEEMKQVVESLLLRDIFSLELYSEYEILTSAEVQRIFLTAVNRRKEVRMKEEYIVLDKNTIPDNVFVDTQNAYNRSQKKRKETKAYKSIRNEIKKNPTLLFHEILKSAGISKLAREVYFADCRAGLDGDRLFVSFCYPYLRERAQGQYFDILFAEGKNLGVELIFLETALETTTREDDGHEKLSAEEKQQVLLKTGDF